MRVFATFEHSLYLELAISELESKGIEKKNIFAISMEKVKSKRKLMDTIHYSDGVSFIDGATMLGSLFLVFGAIYGFLLEWGPIIWGLIGLITGGLIGGLVDYFIRHRGSTRRKVFNEKASEVIVIINCPKEQASWVEELLVDHFALGTAKYDTCD